MPPDSVAASPLQAATVSEKLGALEAGGSPLSGEQRKRVLSAMRLRLTLTVFVVALLLAFSALVYMGVSRIFDWLTPTIRHDLQQKAQRGALDLAQNAQLGMVVGNTGEISGAAKDYLRDGDVVALVVLDKDGQRLLAHGHYALKLSALFARKQGVAHDLGPVYAVWAPSYIEAVEVGRVALAVSKARLEAGMQLRREVLTASATVTLAALALCLLFVNLYIGPILRVTGQAFTRLERTTEAALAASRLKSQFLANMSHEIRTPMNGIVGVLDLLNRSSLTAKQQRYVQTIDGSARALLTIIDEILDFSKLEAGKYVLRPADFEVRQMVQDVAELLAPKAHAKGIDLISRVDSDVPHSIHGDVDRIRQVMTNLVGNAIKFTENGHVVLHVAAEARGDNELSLRVSVTDSGMGIAAEDQTKLFGVFSQVDGSLTRKHGGTGLGLAICKRLAEAMGGTIGVESEPGKGSVFWFTVVVKRGRFETSRDSQPSRSARILVVAYDEVQRQVLCEHVASWGMGCDASESAEEAARLIMDVADTAPFDAAVVDGNFREETEAHQHLFHLCVAEGIPVIRLLATGQAGEGRDAQRLHLCLVKPVRVSELYNGLISMLDNLPFAEQQQRARRTPSDASDAQRARASATVLVVDDNEINRLVAIEVLGELGYAADVVSNGLEALQKAQRGGYGAILMDCQMPEMDGYEATRRIRQLPGPAAGVPIIALTAHAMAGDRDRALQAGMDDYTPKPVRMRTLERVLGRWVRTTVADSPPTAGAERGGVGQGGAVEASDVGDVDGAGRTAEDPHALQHAIPAEQERELDPAIPRSELVIEVFLKIAPEQLEAVVEAACIRDVAELRARAHKLKGSCLSLGASRLAARALRIEREAAQGRIDDASIAALPSGFAVVATELRSLRGSAQEMEAQR